MRNKYHPIFIILFNLLIFRANIFAQKTIEMPEKIQQLLKKVSQPKLDKKTLAQLYNDIATIWLQEGQNDSAYYYLDLSSKSLTQAKKPLNSDLLLNYGNYYFQTDNYKKSLAYAAKGIDMGKKENNPISVAKSHILFSKNYAKKGELENFTEHLQLAEETVIQSEDNIHKINILMDIGLKYGGANMLDQAAEMYVKALEICEKTGIKSPMGYLYCNLGGIFQSGTDKSVTKNYLEKAIQIFKEIKNDKGLGYALNTMGMYYSELKDWDKALYYFNETKELKVRIKDWKDAFHSTCNAAEILINIGQLEKAKSTLAEAKIYMEKSNEDLINSCYYNTYGLYFVAKSQPQKAIKMFEQSLGFAYKAYNKKYILLNMESLANIYKLLGNDKSASVYYKNYIATSDSISKASSQTTYKELQHRLSHPTHKGIESHAKKEKLVPLWLLIAFLILSIPVFYFLKKRKQKNEKLSVLLTNNNSKINGNISKKIVNPRFENDIWEKLKSIMHERKVFLDKDISLHTLALMLDTNTTYLSKVINDHADCNFTTFINQYRVTEACRLLSDISDSHLTIEAIALSCGFNSKSAFNVSFKKIKNITPSEFIASQKTKICASSSTSKQLD